MIFSFPHTFSRYRPIAEIGQGGMAEVILAQMRVGRGIKRLAVLKRLWPDMAAEPEFLSMFLREANISARMNHPNIIQTYEVLEDAERPAIAMEYLDGQPLTRVLNRLLGSGGFPVTLRLRILAQVLMALDYAHELVDYDGSEQGIVHRDVNPRNVIVTYEGQVKLVDFGLAKNLSAAYQTRVGDRGGRLSYMSPEQMRGGMIDRRADIFAAGVMLWEMLAGRRLWQGMDEDAIAHNLTARIPIPPLPRNLNIPPGLERVCGRALAIDPDRRFESAAEFAYELERLIPGNEDSHTRRLGKIVALAFSGERASRRSMIEQHLRTNGFPYEEEEVEMVSPVESRRPFPTHQMRAPSSRVRSSYRRPTRLPPPAISGVSRRTARPGAIWAEDGDDDSSSGVTLTLDAQSILSVEPLSEMPERGSSELVERENPESLRKTTVYVPKKAMQRLAWVGVGFTAALMVGLGVGVARFAFGPRLGERIQTHASRDDSQEPAILPFSAPPNKAVVAPEAAPPALPATPAPAVAASPTSAPAPTPSVMTVLTNEAPHTPTGRRPPSVSIPPPASTGSRPGAVAVRRRPMGEPQPDPVMQAPRSRSRIAVDDVLPPSASPTGIEGQSAAVVPGTTRATDGNNALDFAPSLARSPRTLRPIDTSEPLYP